MMKSKDIATKLAIVTTTLYDLNSESDRLRAELAKKTFQEARKFGYTVIVNDSGSPEQLVREFLDEGAIIHYHKEKGMGKSRRRAFMEAYKTEKDIIIWIEPEKYTFISKINEVVLPILKNEVDIVIPKRKSLKSYPTAQQFAEPLGNAFWKELTRTDLDMWFGPRVFKRELLNYFLNYDGEYGDKWDSMFIPVLNMIFDRKKVASVEIDYTHPYEQTKKEEHSLEFYKKRIEQLNNLIIPLEKHWKKLHENKIKTKSL